MKKYLLLISMLLVLTAAFAQTAKKPPVKEKPPTQKEMAEMMKEMQGAMDEMSPEDKKMMDSLGIKMPSLKNIPKVSDKQLADAFENENRVVPKMDAARIAAISKAVTDSRMGAYLTSLQNKVSDQQKPEIKSMGEKIYSYIKSNSKNNNEAGNMATALLIAGKTELSLFVMGKFCANESANTDNLSNYASMLSMLGGQHLAIPILNNLNAKFPKNSTLLNNLGQAWFGLGEIGKAEKYLDSAIRIYAYHPQANLTKAAIEESKGNISKAIAAVKRSIRHAYTEEKEDRLKKLGYKITLTDVRLPFKPSTDPLGLARFKQPDYPKSVSELKAVKPLWETFDNDCKVKIAQIQKELAEVGVRYEQNVKAMMSQSMQAINGGGTIAASFQKPLYATKASLVMQEVVSHNEVMMKKLSERHLALATELDQLQKKRKKAVPEAPCQDHVEAQSDFLNKCNELKQAYNNEALKVFKLFYNDMAYWSQYTSTHESQFEIIKLEFMIDWLKKLREYRPLLTADGYEDLAECVEEEETEPTKLAEFDDIACQYNSTMDLKIIKFTNNCSRMTSEFDLMFLEYTRKDNFERAEGDTYMSSTVKVSAEIGKDLNAGPLKVEAKIGAGLELEFGRDGLEDVILIGEAKVGAGTGVLDENEKEGIPGIGIGGKDAFPTTVEAGVEGRISLISGSGQLTGSGLMQDIKLAEW